MVVKFANTQMEKLQKKIQQMATFGGMAFGSPALYMEMPSPNRYIIIIISLSFWLISRVGMVFDVHIITNNWVGCFKLLLCVLSQCYLILPWSMYTVKDMAIFVLFYKIVLLIKERIIKERFTKVLNGEVYLNTLMFHFSD